LTEDLELSTYNLKLKPYATQLPRSTRSSTSTFLIGGLWYSPAVFGKAWMRENGFTEESMKGGNMIKIFGLTFLLALISAVNLAMFMGPENKPEMGALWGFLAGAGWVATFVGTHYLFERNHLPYS